MKTVIVNINLEYAFDVETEEKAEELAQDVNLPDNYVSESFEIIKILEGNHTSSGKVTTKDFI